MPPRRSVSLSILVLVLALPTVASAAPPNDDCAAAVTIDPGVRYEETLDSTTATTAVDDPAQSCTAGGANQNSHSVWYQLTPPADGVLSVYTLNHSGFPVDPPTIVSVHTGGCGALAEVACDDSDTGIASYLHTPVTSGVTYWIEVSNEAGSAGGTVKVEIYFDPDSPICPDEGGSFLKSSLSLVAIAFPAGDERLKVNARMHLHDPLPNVGVTGFQLLVEDVRNQYAPIVEWSARTLAVPPGGPGTGCAPKDGWTNTGAAYRYRNTSNAFPPGCAPGSANGLHEIRLSRKSIDWRLVDLKVRATDTALLAVPIFGPTGAPPRLRLSVTAEATIGPENADHCAHSFFGLDCIANSKQTTLKCREEF